LVYVDLPQELHVAEGIVDSKWDCASGTGVRNGYIALVEGVYAVLDFDAAGQDDNAHDG